MAERIFTAFKRYFATRKPKPEPGKTLPPKQGLFILARAHVKALQQGNVYRRREAASKLNSIFGALLPKEAEEILQALKRLPTGTDVPSDAVISQLIELAEHKK